MSTPYRPLRLALLIVGFGLIGPAPAAAQTVFDYRVDRFVVTGQVNFADDFDDGSVVPWNIGIGTAVDTGAELSLSSPGVLMPSFWSFITGSPGSPGIEVSNRQLSVPAFQVSSGSGDFVAASIWTTLPTAPTESVGGFYAMSILESGAPLAGECIHPPRATPAPVAVRTLTVALRDFNVVPAPYVGPTGLAMGLNETVVCVFNPLDPSQNEMDTHAPEAAPVTVPVTGNVVLRMDWDDTLGQMTAAYSVDGGASFQSPFAPRTRTFSNASLQLLGDPVVVSEVPTLGAPARFGMALILLLLTGFTICHRPRGSKQP